MRIIRRLSKKDAAGNPVYEQLDETITGPQGTETSVEFTYQRCPNCNKVLLGAEDLRQRCAYCQTQMCANCEQTCQACKRGVCFAHRSAFAPKNVTLCQQCLPSHRAYEEVQLLMKLVQEEPVELPGQLGVIAKLLKRLKLERLQKRLKRGQ